MAEHEVQIPQRVEHAPDKLLFVVTERTVEQDQQVHVRVQTQMAPSIAAEIEGRTIDLDNLRRAYQELALRHDLVLVEGAGGITVPITQGFNMADLARDLGLPVLVVARPGLGTLNHSVLTVDYARRRGLKLLGLVVSNATPPEQQSLVERTNLDLLPRLTGAPLLGVLTRVNDLDSASFRPDEVPHGGVGERLLAALGNPG